MNDSFPNALSEEENINYILWHLLEEYFQRISVVSINVLHLGNHIGDTL